MEKNENSKIEKKPYGVINADCIEAMKRMPDNCIDAIVTDPPYGLSFMGKNWDHGVPGVEFWKEALRVAKPGAHLLSFGGTRTFHRIACAIEDAGWEIRDTIMWVYGCLSEDTEILTENGWAKIGTIKIGDYAITYDFANRDFRTERVENTYLYDYDDTAYNIVSDTTDQLLSRNHRVVVERGGMETVEYAENLAQEQTICVPVLESVPDVWNDIPVPHEGTGNEKPILRLDMRDKPSQVCSEEAQGTCSKHGVCQMRKGVLHSEFSEKEGGEPLLLQTMQRKGESSSGAESESTSSGEIEENRRGETTSEGKVHGGKKPCVERGSDVNTSSWQLQGDSGCEMSKGVWTDGEKQRICGGTSACCRAGIGQTTIEDGSSASRQPQSNGQSVRESDAIQVKQRPQDVRGEWKSTTTMARIVPVHYTGMIWCISVQSGVIIARRNGKVFITGNSGFPKSMDISKAIDKKLGAERTEVVGTRHRNVKPFDDGNGWNSNNTTGDYQYMAPASEEAKKWNGWGTCLKPAYEPVIMARKPLEGTVVDTVLKYGTGGINIDGCRVPVDGETVCTHSKNAKSDIYGEYSPVDTHQSDGQKLGRFPANIIHDNSEEVVELFPDTGKSTGGRTVKRSGGGNVGSGKKSEASWTNEDPGFGDSGSAARFFYCAKASKSEKGKDNPHPTVKPLELMKYLIKMVAPENSLVLDPFMGSGSTGVAAIQIGRRFLGVEKEEEYFNYAKNRIETALQNNEKKV